MSGKKKEKLRVQGGQLLARGEVIEVMEPEGRVKCRVLSCVMAGDQGCFAALEILEGERAGQRLETFLRAGSRPEAAGEGESAEEIRG